MNAAMVSSDRHTTGDTVNRVFLVVQSEVIDDLRRRAELVTTMCDAR